MARRSGGPRDGALYVISVAAELSGLHPQTLRMYERKGLIEPERTSGRSRRYSEEDIALLRRIQELTNEGLNLAGVQKVLELEHRLDLARQRLARLQQQLEEAERESARRVEAVRREYRREIVPIAKATLPVRRGSRRRRSS